MESWSLSRVTMYTEAFVTFSATRDLSWRDLWLEAATRLLEQTKYIGQETPLNARVSKKSKLRYAFLCPVYLSILYHSVTVTVINNNNNNNNNIYYYYYYYYNDIITTPILICPWWGGECLYCSLWTTVSFVLFCYSHQVPLFGYPWWRR